MRFGFSDIGPFFKRAGKCLRGTCVWEISKSNGMWCSTITFLPGQREEHPASWHCIILCVNTGVQNEIKKRSKGQYFRFLHCCMPAEVQECVSQPKHLESRARCLLVKKGTRFPKVGTSIRDYLSPWHFIGKRPSKRREVNIWLTILHSLDSLVQWDQRVWNGDMAKAKVEMGNNTDRDRNVKNHAIEILRC